MCCAVTVKGHFTYYCSRTEQLEPNQALEEETLREKRFFLLGFERSTKGKEFKDSVAGISIVWESHC